MKLRGARLPKNAWVDHPVTLDKGIVGSSPLAGFSSEFLNVLRHRATTRHMCSLYPFQATSSLGCEGVYLGYDYTCESGFFFDPFAAYSKGLISCPNVLIIGLVGSGKSTVVKIFLLRTLGLLGSGRSNRPRYAAILDPKGEYELVARTLGLEHISLVPGGSERLNPLDVGHGLAVDEANRRRASMITALVAAMQDRKLSPVEESAATWATWALRAQDATLRDVLAVLNDPSPEMVDAGRVDRATYMLETRNVALALEKLLNGSLAGLFDGQSTVDPARMSQRGIVINLAAIPSSDEAFAPAMVCVTSWLQGLVLRKGPEEPQRIQVLEEIWALLGNETTTRYYQRSQKLAREYGVCNVSVAHRLDDLGAQSADGTSASKIAQGLLSDTEVRIVMRQAPERLQETRDALGLTSEEAQMLPTMRTGQGLWKVGAQTALVQHIVAPAEFALIDTDAAMRNAGANA